MKTENVEYIIEPTLAHFHRSDAFIRVIRGPVGSGKSTGCCWEIWRRGNEQKPAPNGRRQSAWLIARNTYRELKDTTLATWLDWFTETRIGKFHYGDMEHRIEFGDLDMLVMFRSLDKPEDVKKILSLELTGAWFNEMREFPRSIVNRTAERVGRYPPAKDGGASWSGIIGDTNPPDDDHWLADAEREPPEGWEFYVQPPGLIEQGGKLVTNPQAENLQNLPPGYYERNLGAMKGEEINVYRRNIFGFVVDGRPVTPEFDPARHVSAEIRVLPNEPLRLGLDVGGGTLNPSAVFFQRHPRGAYLVLAEVVCMDLGVEQFGRQIRNQLADLFPQHMAKAETDDETIVAWGDPAGKQRDELYETAVFEHLTRACGVKVRGAPSQVIQLRIDALRAPMTRFVDGKPGILIHPRCRKLIRGLNGGWFYKRLSVHGRDAFADKPDKGEYSHVCDAAGYGLLGSGEMRTLQARENTGRKQMRMTHAVTDFNVWR